MSLNEDLAYLSGFFEADGCARLYRYGNRKVYRFNICNTDIDVLKWSKDLLENVTGHVISIHPYKGKSSLGNKKQVYYLDTSARVVIADVLKQLLPYMKMRNKIDHAEEIITNSDLQGP